MKMTQAEIECLHDEVKLLRKIADETKRVWDAGGLRLESVTLKNLLTDRIDFNDRNITTA